MKKQTDFKISQVKTFILLPNRKAAAAKRMLSKAARSEREQCNAIPWLAFTLQEPQDQEAGPGSPGRALHEAMWLPGDTLWAGHAASLCWKHNPAETRPGRWMCTEIAQCGHASGVLLPWEMCHLLSFPSLRRTNSHTSTLSPLLFYRSTSTRATWQQKDETEAT